MKVVSTHIWSFTTRNFKELSLKKTTQCTVSPPFVSGIKAICIVLSQSDVSTGMIVSYLNKLLEKILDTRRLDIGVLPLIIADILQLLNPFYYGCNVFTIKRMVRIPGMIIFISSSAPWIEFFLIQIYMYIAARIGEKTVYLIRTNRQFHQLLKHVLPPRSFWWNFLSGAQAG